MFKDLELRVNFWYILLLSLPRIAVSHVVCVLAIHLYVSQLRISKQEHAIHVPTKLGSYYNYAAAKMISGEEHPIRCWWE